MHITRLSKYMNKMTKVYNSKIIVEDFNALFAIMNKTSHRKSNEKNPEDVTNIKTTKLNRQTIESSNSKRRNTHSSQMQE